MPFRSSIFRLPAAALCAAALLGAPPAARAADGSTAPPAGMLSAGAPVPAARPGFFEDEGAARSLSVAGARGIEVDEDAIRADQDEVLRAQDADPAAALISGENGVTDFLDEWHASIYRWLDNTVRTFDLKVGLADAAYEHDLSSFVFGFLLRAGGRGDEGDFSAKARLRADLAFPGVEKRVHLVVDTLGREGLPDADPMKKENDLRVGLHGTLASRFGGRWALGGGLRMRHARPVGYADLEWRWRHAAGPSELRFVPRVVWYTDEGFGQGAYLTWTSPRDRKAILQFVTAETTSESESGVHLEETVRLAFPHHGKGCGWILQASSFPHVKDGGHTFFDDWLLSVTWRDALYRKWMYYSLTPQVDFAEEDGHDAKVSFRIGLDILFGGETRSLI